MKPCLVLSAALLCLPFYAQAESDLPNRKAGLWEVNISSPHGNQVMKQCIDERTDARMMDMVGQAGKACKKLKTQRQGDSYTSEAECDIMGSKVRSKSVLTGDFSSNYEGEVVATYDPPMMGMREMKTKISARWLSVCQAGQKPGDMILPNGMKMNLDDLGKLGKMQ